MLSITVNKRLWQPPGLSKSSLTVMLTCYLKQHRQSDGGLDKRFAKIGTEEVMAEIINLNQYRKSRQRQERQKTASENRINFGRSKPERQHEESERENRRRELEHHQLSAEPEDGQGDS